MDKKSVKSALLKSGATIEGVFNHFKLDIKLGNHGRMVVCPFHNDSTPSMRINENQTAHCFACDLHLDILQLYTALKSQDVEVGKEIWESNDLTNTVKSLVNDLNLEIDIDLRSGEMKNDDFFEQLKELQLETVSDSLYVRNPPMYDSPFSPVRLRAKSVYIYRDYKTKNPLVVKVRYEAYMGEGREGMLYKKQGENFIESMRYSQQNPVKRKTFRFYNVVEGKIVKGPLPDEKKDILYNGERVFEISNDEHRKENEWIWFVEGEKDAETLEEYGFVGCSLMKGAGSKWNKKYNDVFRGCKVIICTDNDDAGIGYEETLFDALYNAKFKFINDNGEEVERYCASGVKKFNRKFFEAENMPAKSDITDMIEKWKANGLTRQVIISKLKEIIERSIDYKDFNSIHEYNGCLYARDKDNLNKRIANFSIVDAINIISTDNTLSDKIHLAIEAAGKANENCHTRIECIHSIFGSPDAFNKTFSVMDCTFLGTKDELFKMKEFILKYKIFHNRYMYPANGMYKHNGEWVTVTPDGTLRKDATFDPDIFSSNTIGYNDLCNVSLPTKEEINRVAPALLEFNTKEIVYNVLGEIGCKLLNARFKDLSIKNHLFSLNGTKGAGKTETSVKIIAAITNNSTRGEYNLTGQTNFTFLKNVSSNNLGGMILQELKRGKMSDYDRNRWSEIFRNNYDRAKSQRGTKDQELNQYDQNNPLITTGEEGIGEESALYERFNIVFMTADKRNSNPVYGENFRILCDNQPVLRGIGRQLLIDIMNLSDENIIEMRKEIESKIRSRGLDNEGFIDRVLNNTINVIQGLNIIFSTLRELGYEGSIDLEEGFDCIINNFMENVLRINDNTAGDDYQNMLLQYQKALDNDYIDKVVGEANKAYYTCGKELWISPSKLRTVVANYVLDSKQDAVILSETEFKKNMVKAGYISNVESMKRKFNKADAKGWYYKVNVSKIEELGLSFITELIEKGEVTKPEKLNVDNFLQDSLKSIEAEPISNKELQEMLF